MEKEFRSRLQALRDRIGTRNRASKWQCNSFNLDYMAAGVSK